jgi:ribose transport system ATP-binding protein
LKILEVSGLSKYYGDAIALNGATLSMETGEIHAIVGENGAGKSTLVKILSGIVRPDAGTVIIDGEPLTFGEPDQSTQMGVSTAFQELSLLPNLTVAENVLIYRLPTRLGVVTKRLVESKAREVLEEWGAGDIDVSAPVASLPLSTKQRIEIIVAMSKAPKILILDEPTAALPDTTWLFERVRALRDAGTCVVYISHKLAEIVELCDRGTIMRNGAVVGEFSTKDFNHDEVISTMIGRSISLVFPPRIAPLPEAPEVLLDAQGVTIGTQVADVSLQLHRGEILGIAGLEGQGQRELFYSLAGATEMDEGTVTVGGVKANLRTPRTALRSGPGIVLVPEERKREGIFADMSSVKNISAPVLRKVSSAGLIRNGREFSTAEKAGHEAHLPDAFLERNVGQLSGGNQQKTVLARTSLTGAEVQLMFDPTRGIDPSAKLEVYSTLRAAAENGAGVLFYSTEIPELIGMCDRILVMYAGQFVASISGSEMTEEKVMAAAVGHSYAGATAHTHGSATGEAGAQ